MRIKKATTRLFALFLALLVLALPASADILFTRQASYSDPVSLGIISGSSAPFSPLQSNLSGNAGNGIFPFLDANGDLRIALSFYAANDTIAIYDPGAKVNWTKPANWNKPLKEFKCSVTNVRAMARTGAYLYVTGYDTRVISRVVMTNDVYAEDKTWTHPGTSGGAKHGEGLFAYNGYLYAIFTAPDGDPFDPNVKYGPNQIWKFDKNLNVIASADLHGRNTDGQTGSAYTRDGNKLYITSLGGFQVTTGGYDKSTALEVVDLGTLESTRLVTGEEAQEKTDGDWQYMFTGVVLSGDKVYLHGTTWTLVHGEKGAHEMAVYETTKSKLASGDVGTRIGLFTGPHGIQKGLCYDHTTGYLWAYNGDYIERYDGGTSWTEYDDNALNGWLTTAAPIGVASSGGSGAVIPTTVPAEAADISAEGGTLSVKATNEDVPSLLAQAVNDGDYSSLITGGGDYDTVTPLLSFTVDVSHTSSQASAAFTVNNFAYTPKSGAGLCALVRKKTGMGSKYDVFPATLKDGVLTFTISPLANYFTENTIVIAETTAVETTEPDKPWAGDGASTSGCDAGFATLALLALIPLGLRRKR